MKTLLPGSSCGQGGGVFVTVMLREAVLMPRPVNELFAAVNGGTAPEPLGPATRTLPAASMSCQRYCSAAACAAERTVVSPVVRTAAVKVMPLLDGAVAIDAANGRTEYGAPWMPIGRSP